MQFQLLSKFMNHEKNLLMKIIMLDSSIINLLRLIVKHIQFKSIL